MKNNEISFFVMSQKGFDVLQSVFKHHPETITAVVGAQDPNVQNDYYQEIRRFCNENDLTFYDRSSRFQLTTKYAIAISWRWIIELPNTQLIIFHDSLLPKYRGFNPLVSALIQGDKTLGVTALIATADFDCGDIIAQSSVKITYPIKVQEAIQLVIQLYINLALDLAGKISNDSPIPVTKQNDHDATYSLWRDENDYSVDWSLSSEEIKRFIDAVGYPYSGASSLLNGKKVRVLDADVFTDIEIENRTPGKIIFIRDLKPVVVCGKGLLKILHLVEDETLTSLLPLSKFRLRFA